MPDPPAVARDEVLAQLLRESNETNRRLAEALQALQAAAPTPQNVHQPHMPSYKEEESFEDFCCKFEACASVYGLPDNKKITSFVTALPAPTFQLLRNLLHPKTFQDEDVTYDVLKEKLSAHLCPKPLIIPSRHAFSKRCQQEGESMSDFMAVLRKLSIPCQFSSATLNERLRDAFVAGIRSRSTLDRIFEEDDADLDKVYKIALAIEKAEQSAQELLHAQFKAPTVHKVAVEADKGKNIAQKVQNSNRFCFACGSAQHLFTTCPEKDSLQCSYCNRKQHCEAVCKQKQQDQKQSFRKKQKGVHAVQSTGGHSSDDDSPFQVFSIASADSYKPWWVKVTIQKQLLVNMQVDSGSGHSFIPDHIFTRLNVPLQTTHTEFKPYGDESKPIIPKGVAQVQVSYKGRRATLPVYVISGDCVPLIGRQWLQELRILSQEDVNSVEVGQQDSVKTFVTKFPEVFADGIGLAKKFTASIQLKPDSRPVFRKARTVPFALRDRIEAELSKMVSDGVLEPVQYSEYATPIVPVIQGDSIRICADYSGTVNPQLEVPKYPLPLLDELLSTISGCTIFAKLDIRKAYLSLPLDPASSDILTINTHKGLFSPKRLMFGCASAPVVWTRFMDRVIEGISGVACFFDDILLGGKSREDLQEKLTAVLQRLQENGLRLNLQKCRFFVDSLTYLGHQVSSSGIRKTNERIEAISSMPQPATVEELRSFLGAITFYGRYFPDMGTVAAPLYEATKRKKLIWTEQCKNAFLNLKKELISDRVLAVYNPNLPVTLCCDASPVAIGAVLQHVYPDGSERPILYLHKKLDSSQVNYSQIDKEAYSIKYAVEKLHHFLIGREFTLFTDHAPLCHIFGKQRSKLPPLCATRLLHYALFLQNFTFQIKYRKSSEHGNADFLSRLPTHSTQLGTPDALERFTVQHMSVLPHSPKEIANETLCDPELREILDKLRYGESIPGQDGNFSLHSGCILKGLRVYIPRKFRPAVLQELHAGHMGIVKVKALARGVVYWRNIDQDIENMCRSCPACAEYKGKPIPTKAHYWEYPARPWERLHIDFAVYGGKNYLLIVDAHSKWPEIFITKDQTSSTVINVFDSLFARYGLPLSVVSDNQTSFVGHEIQAYYKQHGIRHITSPPYHPASNGQCERFVSSMKQSLRTLHTAQGSPQQKLNKFLAAYRRAPHVTTGASPASLFLKRELRTLLNLGQPNYTSDYEQKIRGNNVFLKTQQFQEGQTVAIRSFTNPLRKWVFGTVVARDGDLQYTILVDGELIRRHSNQMRPVSVSEVQPPIVRPSVSVTPASPSQESQPQTPPITTPSPNSPELPVVNPAAEPDSLPVTPPDPITATAASPDPPPSSPSIAQRRGRRIIKQPARYQS